MEYRKKATQGSWHFVAEGGKTCQHYPEAVEEVSLPEGVRPDGDLCDECLGKEKAAKLKAEKQEDAEEEEEEGEENDTETDREMRERASEERERAEEARERAQEERDRAAVERQEQADGTTAQPIQDRDEGEDDTKF